MSPAMDSLAADKRAARERRIDYVEFASIDPDASRAFSNRSSAGNFRPMARITWPSTTGAWTVVSTVPLRRHRLKRVRW